jgi:hypothetical protein
MGTIPIMGRTRNPGQLSSEIGDGMKVVNGHPSNQNSKEDRAIKPYVKNPFRPVLLRPLKGRIILHIPYREPGWTNRLWIKTVCGGSTHPIWNKSLKQWEVSRSHWPTLLNHVLQEFGPVDIWEDHSEYQICNTSCQDATGVDCICRCGGINHGINGEETEEKGGNAANRMYHRNNWHLIDEGTGTLITVDGIKTLHFRLDPINFKPLELRPDYTQYSFSARYPKVSGECPLCYNDSILYVDHCHEHGWIRGRICPGCNIRLHSTEEYFRFGAGVIDYQHCPDIDEIEWIGKCPDCQETGGLYNFIISDGIEKGYYREISDE